MKAFILWRHSTHIAKEIWKSRCVICRYEVALMKRTLARDIPLVFQSRLAAMKRASVT